MKDLDIGKVLNLLKKEVLRFKMPIIDEEKLRTNDPFRILVSAMLSTQTKDEVTEKASSRLFKIVKKPADFNKLSIKQLEEIIYPVSFYKNKARFLKLLPKSLISGVPDTIEELLKIKGVGRKVANLVVSAAFDKEGICVDTHVHRITNRLGYIKTSTPFETEKALREKLPKKYWAIINSILVAYGQNVCKPVSPYCSKCKVSKYCKRAGVIKSR